MFLYIVQALAADKLYPKIEFFAKGYGPGTSICVYLLAMIHVMCESIVVDLLQNVRVSNLNRALLSLSSNITYRDDDSVEGYKHSGLSF